MRFFWAFARMNITFVTGQGPLSPFEMIDHDYRNLRENYPSLRGDSEPHG